MLKTPYVLPAVTRGFTDYFKLNIPIEALAVLFGCTHHTRELVLPEVAQTPEWAGTLSLRIKSVREYVGTDTEQAKREVLISPILTEVVLDTKSRMQIEYPIRVSDQLQGKLDYLLTQNDNLLVVEAKNGDPVRGARQLLAEMVALDRWTEAETPVLWGVLTLGDTWRFYRMERESKIWTQDTRVIGLPDGLPLLARVLTGIITGIAPQSSPKRP